ncbi:MAG: D-alanyl-D-alanine carboxypeptidase [Alphaproteobacteria bacterium]|nr:D-alanyl-D-alanine carboxypeptidase [Alphaproteobacteria bacterium]
MRRLAVLFLLFPFFAGSPVLAEAVQTSAEHAIIMDGDTGQVLWAKDAYTPVPPASMSKLMTLELLFQRLHDHRLKLTDTFPVSERAWRERSGSVCFVNIGDHISIENLIRCVIIMSGNDSCITIAEGVGGTVENFVAMMNQRAKEIGLKGSHFVNPNGLDQPPGQLMPVFDLATLARHLIKAYPELYHFFSERDFVWSNIHQHNRNLVLEKFPGADGLKTGHLESSGYGITVSAVQNGRRLILVLNGLRYPDLAKRDNKAQDWFGEQRRADEAARILGLAFREFREYKLFSAADTVAEAQVWRGERETVPLTAGKTLAVTLTPEARAAMKVSVTYDGPVQAPVAKGQRIGTLNVRAPNAPALNVPLYAADAVGSAGFVSRIFAGLHAVIAGRSAK